MKNSRIWISLKSPLLWGLCCSYFSSFEVKSECLYNKNKVAFSLEKKNLNNSELHQRQWNDRRTKRICAKFVFPLFYSVSFGNVIRSAIGCKGKGILCLSQDHSPPRRRLPCMMSAHTDR